MCLTSLVCSITGVNYRQDVVYRYITGTSQTWHHWMITFLSAPCGKRLQTLVHALARACPAFLPMLRCVGVESPGTPLTVNAVSNVITPVPNEPTQAPPDSSFAKKPCVVRTRHMRLLAYVESAQRELSSLIA